MPIPIPPQPLALPYVKTRAGRMPWAIAGNGMAKVYHEFGPWMKVAGRIPPTSDYDPGGVCGIGLRMKPGFQKAGACIYPHHGADLLPFDRQLFTRCPDIPRSGTEAVADVPGVTGPSWGIAVRVRGIAEFGLCVRPGIQVFVFI